MNDREVAGRDLERFRAFLALLVRMELDPRLQGKVDLSGVVQQTLLEAHQAYATFERLTVEQKVAWLRTALTNNLTDEVRKLGRKSRDISRERSLEQSLLESSARLDAWLRTDQLSPGQHAVRQEQLLELARALDQLPADQRLVIELRHLHGYSMANISELMGRSSSAVGGLLVRGLRKLRELMKND